MKKIKDLVLTGRRLVTEGENVRGNGRAATEVREIEGAFREIVVLGAFHVHVERADMARAVIAGDSNLLKLAEVRVADDVLTVRVAEGSSYSSANLLHVRLQVPPIVAASLVGVGSLTFMDVQQEALTIELSGTGMVTASGRVDVVKLRLPGAGSIDTVALEARHADIKVPGVGAVDAYAAMSTKVRLSGVGNVRVLGEPTERDTRCGFCGTVSFPEQ